MSLTVACVLCASEYASATDWYVSPTGTGGGTGAKESPWNIESALGGGQKIAAGDTIWILGGTYRHPNRQPNCPGYEVRLAGERENPVHLRAAPGQRVTIDGGLSVLEPSKYLWIWDLEILVSENFSMSRWVEQPGSAPKDYNRPWGGLNIHAGVGCKYIDLVIHDNAQGVSFWSGASDSELYGLVIYDNGWEAPDRGHGHAIYTQNERGTKTISDCIMTGGHGYTMHAYGSPRAYVDNYLAEGNICYAGGPFLIGGGRPSQNIRVLNNYLHNVRMQIGYDAPYNENCQVRGNVIVGGGLAISKFRTAVNEDNLVLAQNDPRPSDGACRVEVRPNRYDRNRAHVAIFNWAKKPTVELLPAPLLKRGDPYEFLNPRDLFGKPILTGTFDETPITLPMSTEFEALVLRRISRSQ